MRVTFPGVGFLPAADAVFDDGILVKRNCDFVSHAVHLLSLTAWSEKY